MHSEIVALGFRIQSGIRVIRGPQDRHPNATFSIMGTPKKVSLVLGSSQMPCGF